MKHSLHVNQRAEVIFNMSNLTAKLLSDVPWAPTVGLSFWGDEINVKKHFFV